MAGFIFLIAACGFAVYGFWPTLVGEGREEQRALSEELEAIAVAVEAIILQAVDFPLRAEATGHLAPWRRAQISAEVRGIIVSRPIEEGQYVRKGDLLLQTDDREQHIRLREAEAALLEAQSRYAVDFRKSSNVPLGDTTGLAAAHTRLRKTEQAHDAGTLTRTELQLARRTFQSINVLSGNRRDALQAVSSNLAQSEQGVERAQLELSRTRLVAPFSGRIADLQVEVGQHIAPGTAVLTLLEDDRMKVSVQVLEADLMRIVVGASATVVVPNFSDAVLWGRVHSINPRINPDYGFGRVTVALSNPAGRLISGLHANIALETERLPNRLVVPASAVLTRQGRDLVFKAEHGKGHWTYVFTGERSGNCVEITGAGRANIVEPGDTILVSNHDALPHDAPVEITAIRALALQ